jgi:hypothetical protein
MCQDGTVKSVERCEYPCEDNPNDYRSGACWLYILSSWMLPRRSDLGEICLETCVAIEDREGAIKVANERRTQIIATVGFWPKAEAVWMWGDWSWVEKARAKA